MKFLAYKCNTCGYEEITSSDSPKCPDCGKRMKPMDTSSNEYKKLDSELKRFFRSK